MVQLRALSKGADDNPWYCKFCNKKVTEMGKLMGTLTKKVVKLEKDVKEVKEHIEPEVINQEIVQKCDENKVRELIDNELVKLNIPDKCDEGKLSTKILVIKMQLYPTGAMKHQLKSWKTDRLENVIFLFSWHLNVTLF